MNGHQLDTNAKIVHPTIPKKISICAWLPSCCERRSSHSILNDEEHQNGPRAQIDNSKAGTQCKKRTGPHDPEGIELANVMFCPATKNSSDAKFEVGDANYQLLEIANGFLLRCRLVALGLEAGGR